MLYIMFGLVIIFVGIEFFLYFYGSKNDAIEVVDYIIVLGAGLYGERLSSALKRRLDRAYKYAKDKKIPIIVSGGQGKDEFISEAKAMKTYLLSLGIEEKRIIMEDKSTSTYTNFLYSKKIIGEEPYKLMVVTCDFHMYRAQQIGKQLGFICFRSSAKSIGIKCIKYYIREFFCLLKYWIIKK